MLGHPQWYLPDATEQRALACLAEVWHIFDAMENPPWPGWDPRRLPLALYRRDGTLFLAGHPVRPQDGLEVFMPAGVTGPTVHRLCDLPETVAGGAVTTPYHGVPTAFVPVERVGEEGLEPALRFISLIAHELFHAFQHARGRIPALPALLAYPDDQPVNNAMGNIEGHLLAEACVAESADRVMNLAQAIALIRRERRAQLGDDQVRYEQVKEYHEGLATYISYRILAAAALPGYAPSPVFQRLAGEGLREQAARMVVERIEALQAINRRGLGARRRRFHYTGMGLALLLDRLSPGWKERVGAPDVWLDPVLDEVVAFDGGEGDDNVIAQVQFQYDYLNKLREEREHVRALRRRRRELVAGVLSGPGTIFIFDVSDLQLTGSRVDPEQSSAMDERLQVHAGRALFEFGRTVLSFEGVPVIEDRQHGLFEVRVPGARLRFTGDRSEIRVLKPAEFTEGFELEVGGIRVRAQQGIIHPLGDAVYVKITR